LAEKVALAMFLPIFHPNTMKHHDKPTHTTTKEIRGIIFF
jgi:hypothetical protein